MHERENLRFALMMLCILLAVIVWAVAYRKLEPYAEPEECRAVCTEADMVVKTWRRGYCECMDVMVWEDPE